MKYRLTNLLFSASVPKNEAINDDNSNRMQKGPFPPVLTSRYITLQISIRIRETNKGNEWLLDDTFSIESKVPIDKAKLYYYYYYYYSC